MAKSRNERRKAAKARFDAKVLRQTKGKVARELEAVRLTVRDNMNRPIERNYYPQSSCANMPGQSHRAYVCQNQARPRFNSTDDNGRFR